MRINHKSRQLENREIVFVKLEYIRLINVIHTVMHQNDVVLLLFAKILITITRQ